MKKLNFRDPRTAILAAAVIVLCVWLGVILPIQHHFKSLFLELNPADVTQIVLEMESRVDASIPAAKVILAEDERREFLKLLAECHLTALNHPRFLWACTATITTKRRVVELSIHNTKNNGAYIPLYSNGSQGRNIGVFRNDGLAPFILRVLSHAEPSSQNTDAGPKQ